MSKQLMREPATEEERALFRKYNQFRMDVVLWLENDFGKVIDDLEKIVRVWDKYVDQFDALGFDVTPMLNVYETVEGKIHDMNEIFNDIERVI